jgi:hypothetical protein
MAAGHRSAVHKKHPDTGVWPKASAVFDSGSEKIVNCAIPLPKIK